MIKIIQVSEMTASVYVSTKQSIKETVDCCVLLWCYKICRDSDE